MNGKNEDLATELQDEVHRYVKEYCGALWKYVTEGKAVDYDQLGFWKFPIMMISGAGESCNVTIRDVADFDEMVRAGYEYYYREGWDGRVEVHSAKASIISPTIGVVESTGSRYRADGTVNSSWSCLYLMQRTRQGWKHVGVDAGLPPRGVSTWGRWLTSVASNGEA